MAGKKGMKHYPVEIKLEAVRMFLELGKTRAEIVQRLGLRWEERVKKWVSPHRHEVDAFHKPIGRPRPQPESEQEELKRLRMENDLLKKIVPNCERRRSRRAILDHPSCLSYQRLCGSSKEKPCENSDFSLSRLYPFEH